MNQEAKEELLVSADWYEEYGFPKYANIIRAYADGVFGKRIDRPIDFYGLNSGGLNLWKYISKTMCGEPELLAWSLRVLHILGNWDITDSSFKENITKKHAQYQLRKGTPFAPNIAYEEKYMEWESK